MLSKEYTRLQELAGIESKSNLDEMASESNITPIYEDFLKQMKIMMQDLKSKKIDITMAYQAIKNESYDALVKSMDVGYVKGMEEKEMENSFK